MTTFLYTTVSDGGQITDMTAVSELVSEYYFTVEPQITETSIAFMSDSEPNGGFGVYTNPDQTSEAEQEFFERLAEFLESDFSVKCVEVQGTGEPASWKWSVDTDDSVQFMSI